MAGDSVRLSKNLMRMKVESSTGISTFVPTSSMMSEVMDETAGDRPVRDNDKAGDVRVHPSFLSRMAREDLEDHFLNQKEDIQRLKQQINKQDDKYKKLGTKLSRLVKDRRRMEHLVAGPAAPLSNVEMEEVVEELQDKVRALQTDKETLSRRLLLVRQQQLNSQSQRAGPYAHVKPRVNTGAKRSGSSSPAARLRGTRSVDAAVHPQYGHGLLEEARAEIRNLENRVETQCSQIEELRAELQRKEEEHEDRLQQLRQQQTHNLRSHVDGNVVMIKLQKQLTERSNAFSELEERFICLKETQQTLKLGHELAVQKVEDLTTELKEQQRKTLELEQREQSFNLSKMSMNMLEERICELEQERQLLKENNNLLLSRLELDMVQQQKYDQVNRQQRLQISQLEKALRADLADKNDILEQIRAERDSKMKLSEESQRLQQQLLEHQQQVKELKESRTVEYDHSELTEALLIVKSRRAQKNADLRFLKDEETSEINVREMQAAHAESIQELQKTRELLVVESQISQGYKAELEGLFHQMKSIKAQSEEKLEKQRHLLESREAKIRSLQAQLKDMMYGSKCSALGPDGGAADRDCDGSVQLERGENLLELQLESASLSPSILQVLGEDEPSTFCTYAFYLFGLHSTPMVVGTNPLYDFTSRYVVRVDEQLLQYLRAEQLTVELHHNQGLTWKTIAQASIPLVALTEQDAPLRGSTPLVGEDCGFIGSLNYCLRMKIPIHDIITESLGSTSSQHSQLILVNVESCSGLELVSSRPIIPYVVYKFFTFPDYSTTTSKESSFILFQDTQSYPVHMDSDLRLYLESELLQFYVFDYNGERMNQYIGKAQVSLQPLLQNLSMEGLFPLLNASGEGVGHIQVTIRWNQNFNTPDKNTEEVLNHIQENQQSQEKQQKQENRQIKENLLINVSSSKTDDSTMAVMMEKKGGGAKKVSFVEAAEKEATDEEEHEEEDEEVSCVSTGELLTDTPQFTEEHDDGSEVSIQSDSDDCIVHSSSVRKPSLRLDILCLSLRANSSVSLDPNVVNLFMEFSFLGLQTVETPLSLPKPAPDCRAHYNYSKAILVDTEENSAQRALLRKALLGNDPTSSRVVFTVVSEPPPDEQQDRDCEEVGVAFIELSELLEKHENLMEANLKVLSVVDRSEVIGFLTVSFEGLHTLRSIMDDYEDDVNDKDKCFSSSSRPKT
ncbi:protein fantom-like isoform X2 [Gouania willdenowi]|uniref:protein fantom-like isoform X2 n=1 Tax=Gouania willdenowi TaxID=441366 RepID=UPI0010555F99|nr:protein fantom-like isoform X2 [Gouania willdenowi]